MHSSLQSPAAMNALIGSPIPPLCVYIHVYCRDVEFDPAELGALPDNWEVRYTARGQRYFVNHSTRTTQFTGDSSDTPTVCTV